MSRSSSLLVLGLLSTLTAATYAESHNPADYPLRLHIYRHNETTFYERRQVDEAKGEGRGNLFEGGNPKGVDFQFDCDERLQTSPAFETFPAKWKKPGEELIVLQPKFGTTSYSICRLKVLMKEFVYRSHNGVLGTESITDFKDWMVKHDYDPEHGKDTPVQAQGSSPAMNPATPVPASTAPAPPQ